VTTVTPTGAARVASLFGDEVHHTYIPFETPPMVNRFFRATRPDVALVVETEIWPNLYRGCGVRGVPLVLVSARISPKSVRSYRRLLPLFRETLSHGIIIAAQSDADAERFLSLGAAPERTRVTGNIKFDVELPADLAVRGRELRNELFGDRPVWIAASTHEGEEEIVLEAHRILLNDNPDLLLILVPRHPQRFQGVREMVTKERMTVVARTDDKPCSASTQVFLGDTMGELTLFYAASDVAFVGGSLVPIGGHNLLEPAALGLPLLSGPHVFNAQDIADMFVDKGACTLVQDGAGLAMEVSRLFSEPERAARLGDAGRDILERNRGALARLMAMIEPLVD
jgi:3-deoxy-D-manno-octulosonic-acid transferase